MPEFIPDVATVAERVLSAARRGDGAYVEGPVGSGRNALVEKLRAEQDAVIVDLLPLEEADAPAVAFIEVCGHLPVEDRPSRGTGAEAELRDAAVQLGARLRDGKRFLVLRVPDSWKSVERAADVENAVPSRAAALLHGLFAGGSGVVLVSDAAITAERLGFYPRVRILLPAHHVAADALRAFDWGAYHDFFEKVARSTKAPREASPLAWRLAVGATALGHDHDEVLVALRSRMAIPDLARLVCDRLRGDQAAVEVVARFLAVRRPMKADAVSSLTGAQPELLPLLTMCIGYGGDTVRVTPLVRSILRRVLGTSSRDLSSTHEALAGHYRAADGALSPVALDSQRTRAWCEKVHHLGHAGDAGAAAWAKQELPSPEFYWDRGRRLSITEHKYNAAADVYRACAVAFPQDDYAWHYHAWNLQRGRGAVREVERAYRRAVEIAPENPWWNARLVTFLAVSGQPQESRREWQSAVERVDPEGTQARSGPWLSQNFHLQVCREWIRSGRSTWAQEVVRLVPLPQRSRGPWKFFARRISEGDRRLVEYLSSLERRHDLTGTHAQYIHRCWAWMKASLGEELPLPMAEPTADGERFQFAWSYRSVLVEVEVLPTGGVQWFAKDRLTDAAAGGESTIGQTDAELIAWLRKTVDA